MDACRIRHILVHKFPAWFCSGLDPKPRFAKAIAGSPVNITMTVLSQSEIRISQGHLESDDDRCWMRTGADKDSPLEMV